LKDIAHSSAVSLSHPSAFARLAALPVVFPVFVGVAVRAMITNSRGRKKIMTLILIEA
jgi:hypothetical protein